MQPKPPKFKVVAARSHVGVQVGADVFNSIILGKKGVVGLDLTQWGLHISAGKKSYIIPFPNVQSIEVETIDG